MRIHIVLATLLLTACGQQEPVVDNTSGSTVVSEPTPEQIAEEPFDQELVDQPVENVSDEPASTTWKAVMGACMSVNPMSASQELKDGCAKAATYAEELTIRAAQ